MSCTQGVDTLCVKGGGSLRTEEAVLPKIRHVIGGQGHMAFNWVNPAYTVDNNRIHI